MSKLHDGKMIFIGGPTASGKSAFALRLAEERNGIILNADSMQIYDGAPLLTAQPSPQEKALCQHALYEIFQPHEFGSVALWLEKALEALDDCLSRGFTPIFVGGTGLYFKALSEGLAEIPPIPDAIHEKAQALYGEEGGEAFKERLAKSDPLAAQKWPAGDKQRLIRAYEVVMATGRPLSDWQASTRPSPLVSELEIERYLLMPEREELYQRCDARFLTMMQQGAVEEVRLLRKRNLPPGAPALKILGVPQLGAMLDGLMSEDEAVAAAQQATRNYAKRQLTWFRHQWPKGGPKGGN